MISVIVPTLNSESTLALCLKSIFDQHISLPFEVIVSDCGSSDTTVQIAKRFNAHITLSQKKSASAARNKGAQISSGSYLAFIDSDVVLSDNWLEQNFQSLNETIFDVSQSPVIPSGPSTFINSYRKQLSKIYTKGTYNHIDVDQVPKMTVNTAACMLKKEAFVKAEGFDENLLKLEDTDLMTRIFYSCGNFTISKNTTAQVFRTGNLLDYIARSFQIGCQTKSFKNKWQHTSTIPSHPYFTNFKHSIFFKFLLMTSKVGEHLSQNTNTNFKKYIPKTIKSYKKAVIKNGDQTYILNPFSRIINGTFKSYIYNILTKKSHPIEIINSSNNQLFISAKNIEQLKNDNILYEI